MPKHIGSFQKRSAPLPRRKWKMTPSPSLRTSQDSRTSPLPSMFSQLAVATRQQRSIKGQPNNKHSVLRLSDIIL